MSTLLIQLGDIHFTNSNDLAFERANLIAATISHEVKANTRNILLVFSGDLVNSGLQSQFELALQFKTQLESEIQNKNTKVQIESFLVPGNHDCCFDGDQSTRDQLLKNIEIDQITDSPTLELLTSPLENFFDFAAKGFKESNTISKSCKFYRPVEVTDGDSKIKLHLLNTAWMSSISESPGSLLYPVSELPDFSTEYDVGIAILHHPLNWFRQPDVMRQLKERLNEISSIVLVSHEHVADASKEVSIFNPDDSSERETIYLQGGVIQESGEPDLCAFNIVNVDVNAKTSVFKKYVLNSSKGNEFFKCESEAEDVPLRVENTGIGNLGAELTTDVAEFLEDPGAPITHPHRDPRNPIKLSDIFLCPDLWEYTGKEGNNQQTQITGDEACSVIFDSDKVLIEGAEKSGKTSLLKQLFVEAVSAGMLPLLVDGSKFPKTRDGLRQFIRKEVRRTYHKFDVDHYEQLPSSKKMILIDGAHNMQVDSSERDEFISYMEANFGRIVFCADDFTYQPDASSEFVAGLKIAGYRQLLILGFGEVLRERFVKAWLGLSDELNRNEDKNEVDRICALINLIIRTQLLPTYPIFILLLLQQSDMDGASVQGGSFGKLFEGVVTTLLYRSSYSRINIQDKYSYLASFARKLFDAAEKSISLDDAKGWHADYWENIDISNIEFSAVYQDLITLGILEEYQGQLSFKYDYYYCFFVAYSISRELHKSESTELVSQLTENLHHKLSADIVLFLVHLTGDPVVLDKMISACDALFTDSPKLSLVDGETDRLKLVGDAVGTIKIADSPEVNKEAVAKKQDATVNKRLLSKQSNIVTPPNPENDRQKYFFQMHAANKSIQILGQALRNISGSADKDTKERSIDSIVNLTRRILGECFEIYDKETIEEFVQYIADSQREHNPELLLEDLKKQVHRHLYGQGQLLCFAMIRLLSHSIGSENLSNTLERLLDDGLPIHELIRANYKLELRSSDQAFPRQDILDVHKKLYSDDFNVGVLRFLVAHHLYLFHVPMSDKQAIASKLDLKLLPRDTIGRNKKLK